MHHITSQSGKTHHIEWDGKTAELQIEGQTQVVDILPESATKCHILWNRQSYNTEILDYNRENKTMRVKVNGQVYPIAIKDRFDDLLQSLGMEGAGKKKVKDVKAPMPGLVLDILVSAGQTVGKETPLFILEAMKMENVIKSPTDGVIKKVTATKGNAVEKNSILLEFE